MLQEVIDLQNEAVSKLFACVKSKKEVTLKAPTGSGKTYMMSDFMSRVIASDSNVVFVVSTLSKGGLGEQNFKAFCRFARERFSNLKPFLIDSNDSGEEALHIPIGYNVYVLPRDLYKEKSKLKQGALVNFLKWQSPSLEYGTQGKKIYLIKDECHIATKNLDSLIMDNKGNGYFEKVINISATPKLERKQTPDVEITEEQAVNANLIKAVNLKNIDDESSTDELQNAIGEYVNLKKAYLDEQKGVGLNLCMIIQISNKDKADKEIAMIKEAIKSHSELKYMIIVDDTNSNKCESNDKIAKNKLPVKKWKEYAKGNNSTIDIIVFKMVISEGWDIPRACMLYQMRDSKSKQLDEQVIGRVRRNPRLLDFENLNKTQRDLISKAYIYGVKPKESNAIKVWLKWEIHDGLVKNEIIKEFAIKATTLKSGEKLDFSAVEILERLGADSSGMRGKKDIFTLYRELESNSALEAECKAYAGSESSKWYAFANNFALLKNEYEKEVLDYDKSVEISEVSGNLALESFFNEREYGFDKEALENWIWLCDGEQFAFDSRAEKEWIKIIREIYKKELIKSIVINGEKVALFGKNYPYNSGIKFEYYLNGRHFSYPDFVLKDFSDRIHIFEVKSVDSSFGDFGGLGESSAFGGGEYGRKIAELAKVYKAISKKLPYHFWIPIKQKNNAWKVRCYANSADRFGGEIFSEGDIAQVVVEKMRK
ncbi:DEAD/DEAH box helicase [Helicobacter sp. T3_23-1059]